MPTSPFRELVRSRDIGPGIDGRGQPEFRHRFAAWYTYAPNGAGAGAAGQRWYTAQPTATFAGLPFDPADDLRDHRRVVRHTDAPRPENRAGGKRNAGLPELLGRHVQLQLHRREQQRPVGNHHPATRRPGAPRLHAIAGVVDTTAIHLLVPTFRLGRFVDRALDRNIHALSVGIGIAHYRVPMQRT